MPKIKADRELTERKVKFADLKEGEAFRYIHWPGYVLIKSASHMSHTGCNAIKINGEEAGRHVKMEWDTLVVGLEVTMTYKDA